MLSEQDKARIAALTDEEADDRMNELHERLIGLVPEQIPETGPPKAINEDEWDEYQFLKKRLGYS